jgi:hypothetical protein
LFPFSFFPFLFIVFYVSFCHHFSFLSSPQSLSLYFLCKLRRLHFSYNALLFCFQLSLSCSYILFLLFSFFL